DAAAAAARRPHRPRARDGRMAADRLPGDRVAGRRGLRPPSRRRPAAPRIRPLTPPRRRGGVLVAGATASAPRLFSGRRVASSSYEQPRRWEDGGMADTTPVDTAEPGSAATT